ncbi:MAG: flagellar hook-length control protein FliK, partial [Desulfuromonadaceae bacterium]
VQQVQQGQVQQVTTNQQPAEESAEVLFAKAVDKSASQVPLTQAAMNAKQVADGIVPQHNHLHGQPAPVAVAAQGITAPAAVAAPFAASQQVADSQIFDQVVTHLSGSDKGDMGRMVLRLHPAELGSLRIELMVEGDRIRANLHAQTQQVQEVLERNLGQLRHSLAEQGLKIDHFQVSSDTRQNQQQG